ncbi:hypothetical protein ABH923_000002 [Leifsonia sp. EB41]|uniref:hypothetical protein n=1 Tax=Leifsonia sp. EB41 TaxID=3156260 RepID=UPI003511AA1B
MSRIWVDLIRAECENPERGRERWCRECAVWRLAAGVAEAGGEGDLGADAEEVRRRVAEQAAEAAEDVRDSVAGPDAAETVEDAR